MADSKISEELIVLARTLADWAAPATSTIIYLYGSRVRGDHRPDSDVDVCVDFGAVGGEDVKWWTRNNENEFAEINAKLPGKLQILETNDPLKLKIVAATVVHEDRNVQCVILPPKK